MVCFYTELCLYWSQFNELYGIVCTIQIITISCGLNICKILYIVAHFHFSIVKWQSIKCYKIVTILQNCCRRRLFLLLHFTTLKQIYFHQLNKIDNLSTTYPQVIHIVIHIIHILEGVFQAKAAFSRRISQGSSSCRRTVR